MQRSIVLSRRAIKQYERLPRGVQEVVGLAISDLEEQGVRPQGWNCRKLSDGTYRLRLNYRCRLRFKTIDADDLILEVFYLGHRKDAYRK